ncbi:MAG: cell division protein ZapA [Deltaproteobacteria bacterium]|jgi:cell division protein ZapA (FtsZ GTPase activity inhibitor)|nr:cell division protein ZapA [Deltaproteobacteria bacterium]
MQPVKIRIRDYEYLVKTEENEEQIDRIAKYINEKLKEIQDNTEGLSEKKMAILVALHIAGDYFQLLKERDEMLANIRQRTEALIYNIDSMMG